MPKLGNGIPYFDIQTDISEDKRIKLLRAEFGIKGFGIWIELIRQIYADEGYFMEWDNDTKLLFASDVGETGGLVDEVVKGSVKRGLFSKSVFNQFNVLTSKHIQEKYFNAIKRRTTEMEVDARYLVIDTDEPIISGNDNIKLLNVNISQQSRVEKSKEEESREEKEPDRSAKPPGKRSLDGFENHRRLSLDRQDIEQWLQKHDLDLSDQEFQYEISRFRDKFAGKRYKDWVATLRNYFRSRYLDPEHFDYKTTSINGPNNHKTRGDRQAEQFFE